MDRDRTIPCKNTNTQGYTLKNTKKKSKNWAPSPLTITLLLLWKRGRESKHYPPAVGTALNCVPFNFICLSWSLFFLAFPPLSLPTLLLGALKPKNILSVSLHSKQQSSRIWFENIPNQVSTSHWIKYYFYPSILLYIFFKSLNFENSFFQ